MKTWIALFRGINVMGTHKLPMKELRELLESIGCSDVKTYIQSGNAVFRSPVADASRLATRISKAVATGHGFEPRFTCTRRTASGPRNSPSAPSACWVWTQRRAIGAPSRRCSR